MKKITAQTRCGLIEGTVIEEQLVFRGVPFATCERFEAPKLIDSFDKKIIADKENEVLQSNAFNGIDDSSFYGKEYAEERERTYEEKYLTMNIITPSLSGKRPVMVFIHGGAFELGETGTLPYGSSLEYARRDVVLAVIPYRVNVFGLYDGINHIYEDILAGLEWVRINIADYGGDADNITLCGQSAGAVSILQLLCGDSLKGKISRAIIISGTLINPWFRSMMNKQEAKRFWAKVRKEAGCDDLKNVDAKSVFSVWRKVRSHDGMIRGFLHMQPCIDGEIIKEDPGKSIREGKIADIPLIIGITAHDMLSPFIGSMTNSILKSFVKHNQSEAYAYFFERCLPGEPHTAFHASDLWYFFGNMDKCWREFEEKDYELSRTMIADFVSFCKNGKPDPDWHPYNIQDQEYRVFDTEEKGHITYKECRRRLIHNSFKNK